MTSPDHSRRFHAPERAVQIVVLCSAALVASCAAPSSPLNGFDVDVRAMSRPDCISSASKLSVGVLDLAQLDEPILGYLALADAPATLPGIPVSDEQARFDTVVESFSLERGAFTDSALLGPHASDAPAVFSAQGSSFPFLLASGAPGAARALTLVDSPTAQHMASDPALTKILAETNRVRLSIVAQLVGEEFYTYLDTQNLAPAERGPFQFRSAPFSADIDLCNGCLASPMSCPDGSAPIPNPASCNPGQDVPTEVCP